MIFILIAWFEHKIIFKKYLIEQQFGHFFVYQPINRLRLVASLGPPRWVEKPKKEMTCSQHVHFLTCHCCFRLIAVWAVSWRLIDTQHEKIIVTVTKGALLQRRTDLFYISYFSIWLTFLTVLSSWLECEHAYSNGDKMSTQAFKKRIYEVKSKTYFVLQPSLETQNQIKVIHLNYICDWTVGARTWNMPS